MKWPGHVNHVEVLLETYPDARIVVCHRDPRRDAQLGEQPRRQPALGARRLASTSRRSRASRPRCSPSSAIGCCAGAQRRRSTRRVWSTCDSTSSSRIRPAPSPCVRPAGDPVAARGSPACRGPARGEAARAPRRARAHVRRPRARPRRAAVAVRGVPRALRDPVGVSSTDSTMDGRAWHDFCDRLASLGDRILDPDFPGSPACPRRGLPASRDPGRRLARLVDGLSRRGVPGVLPPERSRGALGRTERRPGHAPGAGSTPTGTLPDRREHGRVRGLHPHGEGRRHAHGALRHPARGARLRARRRAGRRLRDHAVGRSGAGAVGAARSRRDDDQPPRVLLRVAAAPAGARHDPAHRHARHRAGTRHRDAVSSASSTRPRR